MVKLNVDCMRREGEIMSKVIGIYIYKTQDQLDQFVRNYELRGFKIKEQGGLTLVYKPVGHGLFLEEVWMFYRDGEEISFNQKFYRNTFNVVEFAEGDYGRDLIHHVLNSFDRGY